MKAFGQIMKIGLPAGIQSAVFAVSNIVIQSAINSLGKVVMAASSAAYMLWTRSVRPARPLWVRITVQSR